MVDMSSAGRCRSGPVEPGDASGVCSSGGHRGRRRRVVVLTGPLSARFAPRPVAEVEATKATPPLLYPMGVATAAEPSASGSSGGLFALECCRSEDCSSFLTGKAFPSCG